MLSKPRVQSDLLDFGNKSMKCHKGFREPDKGKGRAVMPSVFNDIIKVHCVPEGPEGFLCHSSS